MKLKLLNIELNVKMGSFQILAIVLMFFFCSVSAISESRVAAGYSMGLLPDCPGSWKPAVIKPKTLKKLSISVMGPGSLMGAKLTSYNYYGIKSLAEDPDIDFKNKKTFIYIPGYLDSNAIPLGRGLGHTYRRLGYNALILDMVYFTTNYMPVVARFARPVGKHVAEMLANLTSLGLDPKDLELVGLSLGGQTMGFIAKSYREITGKNISTLVGLEPCGPCFRNLGTDQRLAKSDADFVLTVTANMDGFGMPTPMGHVSFYVNGGEWQPGDVWWFPCGLMCSHLRVYFLWASALLNPGKFLGMECDSLQQARDGDCYDRKPKVVNAFDKFTDRSKPGVYFLGTTNRYPYYLGKKGLERSGEMNIKLVTELNKEDMMRM